MKSRLVIGVIASFLFVSFALAQGGSLSYGPAGLAVPAGSGLWLGLLAALLAAVAMLAIHRRNRGRANGVLLVLAASLLALGGGLYVHDAGAPPVPVELSNPAGGTVSVLEGPMYFLNTSGVALRINAITAPCSGGVNSAGNACAVSQQLAVNAGCETNFQCPVPETCDGVDNDLNSLIDDGVTPPLGMSCSGASPVCAGASGWVCPPACTPSCSGKACGDDGCGGSCGSCGPGFVCNDSGGCDPEPV